MVSGRFKSRSLVRRKVKLPGGRTTIHYKKRKKKLLCAKCGKPLHGRKLKGSKSEKTVARPYANLCSSCAREEIKKKAMTKGGVESNV